MTDTKNSKQKLPPEVKDRVIEVSLRQVIWGFTMLIAGSATVAAGIIVLRDYSKYKRQEAIINSAVKLIEIVRLDQKGESSGS